MGLVYQNRVAETTSTTGTGTYSLAGAKTGFRGFVDAVGNANQCYYCCTNGVDWEIGYGTVTDADPDTLSRTLILSSSNGEAAVDWGAGNKDIFVTMPAQAMLAVDTDGNVSLGAHTLSTLSGLISPKLYPSSDSPTAVQITKADGTTGVLVVDTSNLRVGVNTTPLFSFHVVATAASAIMPEGYSGGAGTAVTSFPISSRTARGTLTSPSALQTGDILFGMGGRGYGATGFTSTSRAAVTGQAAENWTDSAQGTYLSFIVTPTSSTTPATAMTILGNGNVGIGNTGLGTYKLNVTGTAYVSSDLTGGNSIGVTGGNAWFRATSANVMGIIGTGGGRISRLNFGQNGSNVFDAAIGLDAVNGFTLLTGAGGTTWRDNSTAQSGTVANRYIFGLAIPTLSALNASITYTNAASIYIEGAPSPGSNVTIGTSLALNVASGNSYFGGNLGIGTLVFGTSAAKVLGIGSGTAPASSPADMAQLWVEDVGGAGQAELRVRDELGNITTLSPHDSDGPAAIYTLKPGIENVVGYRNQFRGAITWINHETGRVIRETFAKYNARRAGSSGHRDLVAEDWDANERLKVEHAESERSKWREQLAEYRLAIAKRSRLPWILRGELPQPPGAEPPAYHVRPNPFVGV